MLLNSTARLFYFDTLEDGRERSRIRTIRNVNIHASNENIITLSNVFEALTGETYYIVERQNNYLVK